MDVGAGRQNAEIGVQVALELVPQHPRIETGKRVRSLDLHQEYLGSESPHDLGCGVDDRPLGRGEAVIVVHRGSGWIAAERNANPSASQCVWVEKWRVVAIDDAIGHLGRRIIWVGGGDR